MTREALLEVVLKLPHTEPAGFAAELIASLDEEPADNLEGVEKAWAAEIERRARPATAGGSAEFAWEEVKQRIADRLAKP